MCADLNYIEALNLRDDLDFFAGYNRLYHDIEIDDDPYIGIQTSSLYYDANSLTNSEILKSVPLYLSINIQSLQSKFDQLSSLIADLTSKNIQIDLIALQETWDVCYPDLFTIPGFKPVSATSCFTEGHTPPYLLLN
jgi:hypothetical protein